MKEPLQYSGGDVEKMTIIGFIRTVPIGPYSSTKENIVEIINSDSGAIYVLNKWYKAGIPQLVHEHHIKIYIPLAD